MFKLIALVSVFGFHLQAAVLADVPAFSLTGSELQQKVNAEIGSPHSATVILVDDEHWVFRADNTIERTQHSIYKVVDASGVQSMSGIQERWEPWHEQRPDVRARVITPDGTAHELDPKSLVDATAGNTGPAEYSDLRVLQGPLPAIEVGAIVESQVTQTFTPILGSLVFRGYISWGTPVRFSRMHVEYPQSLPFHYSAELCPDLKETKEVNNGVVSLTINFGSFEAQKQVEPMLPFDAPRVPSVTLSTGASWNEMAKTYGAVVDKQIADAPIQDFIARASVKNTNRTAAISQLVRALHKEVRYTGVEFADAAIVPAKPADTLARKYGDCKDKASLLVALLRSVNIPAYVALLNAGSEQDVSPAHPGMGLFNHAIVYVPGSPELWIDATAEHMAVGTLPPLDEGRLALIIRSDTTGLVKIPESSASANTVITAREYVLPDFGPARVSQSLVGNGAFDATYRDIFAFLDNDEFRKAIEKQTQTEWNTKSAIAITHQSLDDYKTPFKVTMDIRDVKSITVSETGSTITLNPITVLSGLPNYFGTPEDKEADSKDENKKPRTAGYVLPTAFVSRLSCDIRVPNGFELKKLPSAERITLGPASYTAQFVRDGQTVHAELVFDTAKRNYSLAEGQALRTALVAFLKQPAPVLTFEPTGQTLLDQGHYRQALDAFRVLTSEHASEPVNHIRLARAYLAIGCGQQAREEAQLASKMAPQLTVASRNLAFIYEHDLIGRKFRPGWDPITVETALRKAMLLDPDDASIPVELARALEFDASGSQYASLEGVHKAVEIYLNLGDDKLEEQSAQDSLLWDLACIDDIDAMSKKLDRFGANGSRVPYHAFLIALRQGGAKAAAELQSSSSTEEIKAAAPTAIGLLSGTAHYQQAADLAAALQTSSSPQTAIDTLRNTHPVDPKSFHLTVPQDVVAAFLSAQFDPSETNASLHRFWSQSLDPEVIEASIAAQRRNYRVSTIHNGMETRMARDTLLSNVKFAAEPMGDDSFRVRVSGPGIRYWIAVAPEGGELRLLGNAALVEGIARRILGDVQAGKTDAARRWLDAWREDIKLMSEDDPLGGPVFPRLWNRGAPASQAQIRYAAAAMLGTTNALPLLREAIASTSDETSKNNYRLAYIYIALHLKAFPEAMPEAKAVAAAYPNSDTAQELLARTYLGAGQAVEAEHVLQTALTANPDDLALKRELADTFAEHQQWGEAIKLAQEAAEGPNAAAVDWNQYGWLTLLAGQVSEDKIHQVEHGQTQPTDGMQQTIASMYAEAGNLSEARRLSLDALDRFGHAAPDASWWYVFGRIAEQVGARASAIAYYNEVKPIPGDDGPLSTYGLAQKRLAVLNASKPS